MANEVKNITAQNMVHVVQNFKHPIITTAKPRKTFFCKMTSSTDIFGRTPLHCAIDTVPSSHEDLLFDICEKLYWAGYPIQTQAHDGSTPLHAALRRTPPSRDVAALLLLLGADWRVKDNNGVAPWQIAEASNEFIQAVYLASYCVA